ncbi:MAG: hypothetical protein HFJ33_03345 [Clostridia bacterium]|nr:hypothetical protein [Clostridia bacterium]
MRKINSKGITLVALVVTIVVLIILAGVTIASLTGEKGIIKEARTAKELAEKASLEEQVDLAIIKAEQKHRNPGMNDVIEELKNSKVISKNEQVNQETGSIITDLGYEITGKLDDYIGKVSTGDNEGNTSGGNGTTGGNTTGNNTSGGGTTNPPAPTLPSTEDTKPFLPEGCELVEGTNLDNGLVIKDEEGNEWVWIEVPKSIYPVDATSSDTTAIENAMKTYSEEYNVRTYPRDTREDTPAVGINDTIKNYWDLKRAMLSNVFENGGFYIGRYMTGTATARYSSTSALENISVVKKNVYPYNFVSLAQAQEASEMLHIGNKTGSLMFDIQYRLLLKFIDNKKGKTSSELSASAKDWANCKDSEFEINEGKYTTTPTVSGSWDAKFPFKKSANSAVLLTTGSRESVLNIYDLAGNVYSYTLGRYGAHATASATQYSGHYRIYFGGAYDANGKALSKVTAGTLSGANTGFRTSVW